MATVNKRTWRTKDGKEKSAWYADYFDQDGKRHIKTFERKKDAEDWLAKTQVEVKAKRRSRLRKARIRQTIRASPSLRLPVAGFTTKKARAFVAQQYVEIASVFNP
jgi:hypothetical protein